jgi:uncharacterized 2Fe-2S/4Fe-4S cluster protein (DUF4445 family)
MNYLIEFEPVGRRGECPAGKSLLECARNLGVDMVSICGGLGKCKACKVQIMKGKVSSPTSTELNVFSEAELNNGWRLACLTFLESDCTINLPPDSMMSLQRTQLEGKGNHTLPESAVISHQIKLPKPAFDDLRSDATRLIDTLNRKDGCMCQEIDLSVMQGLSKQLRSWDWQAQASVKNHEIVALNPYGSPELGLAVDVGTTKIAAYLIDLKKGETLTARGMMNPQIRFGEDITSRMHYALKTTDGASKLQEIVISGLNQIVEELCQQIGTKTSDIIDSVIVGNTAMHHLLSGLSVISLSIPPFTAAVQDALDIKARDIGLRLAPGAYVHLLPNIAGFIGADHVSMLLGIEEIISNGLTLAIDIGTNTEVSLIDHNNISSVSCASGPAFEGGHISCGMRASSGAIERLKIENSTVQYQTVGGDPPTGICGSGIVDSIAQMYRTGALDASGRMNENFPGVQFSSTGRNFVLFDKHDGKPAITISQRDVREVQLAKAAIRTGIQVLLNNASHSECDIDKVVIAGAFGSYIDVESAVIIGMFPVIPLEKFNQVGNAAGTGARQALCSIKKRSQAKLIASRMHYIELANARGFNKIFIQSQYLGKYRLKDGAREIIS